MTIKYNSKVSNSQKGIILTGKSHYSFLAMSIIVLFFAILIQFFFEDFNLTAFVLTILLGLIVIYFVTAKMYFVFYVYDDHIIIKYPLKFKEKEENIPFINITHLEFLNNLRGPNIVVLHHKNHIIKTNKLHFYDFFNKKVFVFLRFMYSKGIEIDISNCAKQASVLKKIKGL